MFRQIHTKLHTQKMYITAHIFQPHKKFWDMGGGDAKPDQTQGMFQNSPWNRPRDDGGWSGGGSGQAGMSQYC